MKQSTLNFRIEGESVIWDSGGQPSQASARERKLWAEIEQLRAALKGLHKACVHPMLYRPDSQCNAEQSRQKKRALETYSTACEATVNALRLSTPIDSGSSPACHASTSDETTAGLTDWEKARDVVQGIVRQTSGDMRVGALHCLHAIADAMRGTPATPENGSDELPKTK